MANYKFKEVRDVDKPRYLERIQHLREYLGMSWTGIARVLFQEFGVPVTNQTVLRIYNREIVNADQ